MNELIKSLIKHTGMVTPEQLRVLHDGITTTVERGVVGDIVEIGCNRGDTSLLLQASLDFLQVDKALHLYDSFQGLPHIEEAGEHAGHMRASIEEVLDKFSKHNMKAPTIHKGWFKDTLPSELPEQIAFAFVDTDLYSSTDVALENLLPKMAPGGIVFIHDYQHRDWPGVRQACDKYFSIDELTRWPDGMYSYERS